MGVAVAASVESASFFTSSIISDSAPVLGFSVAASFSCSLIQASSTEVASTEIAVKTATGVSETEVVGDCIGQGTAGAALPRGLLGHQAHSFRQRRCSPPTQGRPAVHRCTLACKHTAGWWGMGGGPSGPGPVTRSF